MTDLFNLPIPHPRHRPSTSEIQTSPSVISALERSIKDIQNQVNQLQLQLEALQQRKANCLSYVAPLRRLPPEILSNIITFCLEKGIEITTLTQSCGVIRDAVLDMPTIWRNIHLLSGFDPHLRMLTYGRNKKLGIRCFTQEQLETVLTRSKSTPLRLNLEWPVDERSLELISSRNRLIESLNVNAFETKIIRSERNFSILNFASLKHLHLTSLDSMIVENLLNAILQSISDGMALTLVDYSLTTIKQFLEHHINQRITNLCIVADDGEPVDRAVVPLPRVLSSKIRCHPVLLGTLGLTSIETLEFTSTERLVITPSSIPNTLTRLALCQVSLKPESSLGIRTQLLPELVDLVVKKADIRGSLANYLITPKLRRLYFDEVTWDLHPRIIDTYEPRSIILKYPFHNVPQLETFVLRSTPGEQSLLGVLQDCHHLRHFSITQSPPGPFVPSFVEYLCGTNSFPNLQSFHADRAWYYSASDLIPYREFTNLMKTHRPHLLVTGNGEPLLSMAYAGGMELSEDEYSEDEDDEESDNNGGSEGNRSFVDHFSYSDPNEDTEEDWGVFDLERDMLAVLA